LKLTESFSAHQKTKNFSGENERWVGRKKYEGMNKKLVNYQKEKMEKKERTSK
jgi:hypothetical protein